jgi:hypothetical protein
LSSAFKNERNNLSQRHQFRFVDVLALVFGEGEQKMARSERIPMIMRKPPLLPYPGLATRCLMI